MTSEEIYKEFCQFDEKYRPSDLNYVLGEWFLNSRLISSEHCLKLIIGHIQFLMATTPHHHGGLENYQPSNTWCVVGSANANYTLHDNPLAALRDHLENCP